MKKTLVALTLAALTTGAFADTTVYQTDQGRVYVDGNVRLSGVLFNNEAKSTSGNTTSVTQRYSDGRSYVLRLVLGGGFDAKVGEKGTFGAYLSYYKEFYTSKYTNDLTSTVVKAHNGRPVYLKVGRFYYDYDNFVRVTFGLRGEKDAAQYWQFTDALEYARDEYVLTANHLVLGARTAFDLVDRVNYAPGTDKRTVRADFFFGENKEHYASVSYADNKTATSSEYGTQFAGVYGYKGFKDLVLQVVASAGHYNGSTTWVGYDHQSLDFSASYNLTENTQLSGSAGVAKETIERNFSRTFFAANVQVLNTTYKYAQPALGYSYVFTQSTLNSATRATNRSHTVYGRVYSQVADQVLVGVEASVRRTDNDSNTTGTKSKTTVTNYGVFAKYSF